MEQNTPWITCRMGKKIFLLAGDERAFYLIEMGKRLDYDTEEWFWMQGVSENLLKELQLAFTYIPRKELRGVAFTGWQAGETLYLYLRSEKKKLILEQDYEPGWLDDFFAGIHRFTAPKPKMPGVSGWRRERQDPQLFQKLRYVSPAFLAAAAVGGIGYVATWHWGFFTLLLLCLAGVLSLAAAMPAYFTIHCPKGKKKQRVWDLEWPLLVTGIFLFLGFNLNWMSYRPLPVLLLLGAVLGALVYWRVVDLHQEAGMLFSSLFLGAFVAVMLAGQINTVYDFTPGESYVLEVEDLRSTSGKNRRYYCTVTLPDGREADISISRSLYRELEEGDLVRVVHDTGVLGIEYVGVSPME